MQLIPDYLENLSARERWLIFGGGGILLLIIVYLYIWQPFSHSVTQLRSQAKADKELLAWMRPAVNKVKALKAQGAIAMVKPGQSLLVIANQSTQAIGLASYVSQIQQSNTNEVSMTFAEVPFDNLVNWLETLWKKYGIKISQLTITPLKTQGLVHAQLTLQQSGTRTTHLES